MRIKLKTPILDYEGKEIPAKDDPTQSITYFDVFLNALNMGPQGEILTPEIKNKIYQISKKMYSSNEPHFTPEQLTIIKERVGKAYTPMVYGRVCDLIDGVEDDKEAETKTTDKPSVN